MRGGGDGGVNFENKSADDEKHARLPRMQRFKDRMSHVVAQLFHF